MKLTFWAALHLGLAMLWQLFHIHHPSSLSASPMTYRTASPCSSCLQYGATSSFFTPCRSSPIRENAAYMPLPATYRRRQTEGARCSILVFLLQLFLLFFVFLFFGFPFFFLVFFFFFFLFILLLFLLLLLLLLLLLRLPAATALSVAAAAANATAALRLLLRPLPAAAAATAPGAAAAPGSKRKLTNSFSPAWKPLFLDLETLVLKPYPYGSDNLSCTRFFSPSPLPSPSQP